MTADDTVVPDNAWELLRWLQDDPAYPARVDKYMRHKFGRAWKMHSAELTDGYTMGIGDFVDDLPKTPYTTEIIAALKDGDEVWRWEPVAGRWCPDHGDAEVDHFLPDWEAHLTAHGDQLQWGYRIERSEP